MTALSMASQTVVRHDVSVLDTKVNCSCRRSWTTQAWGPLKARQLAYAHVANPTAETDELLRFVTPQERDDLAMTFGYLS